MRSFNNLFSDASTIRSGQRVSRYVALAGFAGCVVFTSGCSFVMRDQATYRADTREVLETRQGQISSCYEEQLAVDQSVEGTTVVNFVVEKKSGTFMNAELDESSTAPPALNACILEALDGLALSPEDQRQGNATFTWRFSAPSSTSRPDTADSTPS